MPLVQQGGRSPRFSTNLANIGKIQGRFSGPRGFSALYLNNRNPREKWDRKLLLFWILPKYLPEASVEANYPSSQILVFSSVQMATSDD
jgi:hypothetical protein